ncbi:hypothetical protein MBLNU457_4301t2 [Dothideomycetes sp. NU457]
MSQAGHSTLSGPPMTPPHSQTITGNANDWVHIKVQGQTFKLRYDVLESSNEYFQFNMSTEQFLKTDHPRALSMDDDDPLLIALFVSFLRRKTVDRSLIGEEDPYIILFNAYRQAKYWNDDRYQNAVIDAITMYVMEGDPRIGTLPKLVWGDEPAGSALRKLVLDAYVWIGGANWLTVEALDGMTGDFIMDLAKHSISTFRSLAGAETSPFTDVGCRYHEHGQEESCDHTKHDRITIVDQDQRMADTTGLEAGAKTMDGAASKDNPDITPTVEGAAASVVNHARSDKKEDVVMDDTDIVPHRDLVKDTQGPDQDTARQDGPEGKAADEAQLSTADLDSSSQSQGAEAATRASSTSSSITWGDAREELRCETPGQPETRPSTMANEQTLQATTAYADIRSALVEPSKHPVTRMSSMGPSLLTNRSSTPMPLRARTPIIRSATEPVGEIAASQISETVKREQLPPFLRHEAKAAPAEAEEPPKETKEAPEEAKKAPEAPVAQQEIKEEEKNTPTKRRRDDDNDSDIEITLVWNKTPKKNAEDSSKAGRTPATPTKATPKKQATPKKTGQAPSKASKTPATAAKATPKKVNTPKKKKTALEPEAAVKVTYDEAISLD